MKQKQHTISKNKDQESKISCPKDITLKILLLISLGFTMIPSYNSTNSKN
jgi:hypothetical protein